MTDRNLALITNCGIEVAPGIPCGRRAAGVDFTARRFLCPQHLQAAIRIARDAERLDDLPTTQQAIDAAYAILRSNDGHLRELREREQQ